MPHSHLPDNAATPEIDARLDFLDDPAQRIHAANAIRKLQYNTHLGLTVILTNQEARALAAFHDTVFLYLGGMMPEVALSSIPWQAPIDPDLGESVDPGFTPPHPPKNLVAFPTESAS